MKAPYGEGVANHTDPESCGGDSNVMAEALTGEGTGQVLSRENLLKSRVPTLWDDTEGNIGHIVSARCVRTLRGRRPCARTDASYAGTGRSHIRLMGGVPGAALGSLRTQSNDERLWEVGQRHST